MAGIEELLHRRTDLSTFLVHFTKDAENASARDVLITILREGILRRGRAMGMAARKAAECRNEDSQFYESQQVICFTETPLEHAWMMCQQIEGRQSNFRPYGISFTKTWGRARGANPIWYLDISARGLDWLTQPVNKLMALASDPSDEIFKLTPFIEQMGPTGVSMKEFWWEREWRVAGRDVHFSPRDTVVVLAPEEEHVYCLSELERQAPASPRPVGYFAGLNFVDPAWGLERMIAKLAGVPDDEAGPLPRLEP